MSGIIGTIMTTIITTVVTMETVVITIMTVAIMEIVKQHVQNKIHLYQLVLHPNQEVLDQL
jgi:hypothetical protein